MPIRHFINHELQLNFTIASGNIPMAELVADIESLTSHPDYDRLYDSLYYFSSNAEADIRGLSYKSLSKIYPEVEDINYIKPKLAIISQQAYSERLSRIYQASRKDIDIKLFSKLQDASEWLDRDLLDSGFSF